METLKSILKLKIQQQHHQTIPMQHNKQGQKSLIILFNTFIFLLCFQLEKIRIIIFRLLSQHPSDLLCYDYYELCCSLSNDFSTISIYF